MQLSFRRSNAWWTCVWKGEFQTPGRNAGPQAALTARAQSRPAPQRPAGPSCPRGGRAGASGGGSASTSPCTPRHPFAHLSGTRSPTATAGWGPDTPAGALRLGSRRSHGPSSSRGSRRAAPRVPQSPGSGAHRSPAPEQPSGHGSAGLRARSPAGAPQPWLPQALPRGRAAPPPHPGTPAGRSATTTSRAPRLQKLNEKKITTEELYKPRPAC